MEYLVRYKFYYRGSDKKLYSLHGSITKEENNTLSAYMQCLKDKLEHGEKCGSLVVFHSIKPIGRARVE